MLHDLRELMAPDDVLVSDVGAHKLWVARFWEAREPNTVLISNGFAAMGFGLPATIAAALARRGRSKVVCISGDGGFLMNVQELETARRLGLPFVILVWSDGGYGLIEMTSGASTAASRHALRQSRPRTTWPARSAWRGSAPRRRATSTAPRARPATPRTRCHRRTDRLR